MTATSRREHWAKVYATKAETEVSWFQETPAPSLELIDALALAPEASVIDIGAGASRLIEALWRRGFRRLAALDISAAALDAARRRLEPEAAAAVDWIEADAVDWRAPEAAYDLWHDRAAFHFLVEASDRRAYVDNMQRALRIGGHAIMASFARDGPERCSGLPVARYDGEALAEVLGPGFARLETRRDAHLTPGGGEQRFQFSLLRRVR